MSHAQMWGMPLNSSLYNCYYIENMAEFNEKRAKRYLGILTYKKLKRCRLQHISLLFMYCMDFYTNELGKKFFKIKHMHGLYFDDTKPNSSFCI
jgi:hypothetical protein